MDFKKITIPYKGRERYPSNGSGESVRTMISNYLGGSSSSSGGGGSTSGGNENRGGNASSFFCFLSKSSGIYSAIDLAQTAITDYVQIMGYRENEPAQTLVGNISAPNPGTNYSISGMPVSGLSVSVVNNGTSASTLAFTFNSDISSDSGTLTIPVAVNINDNQLDPYHAVWYEESSKCVQMELKFTWTINRAASGNYVLDLSNQTAGVNCDSAGTLYPNSIATLTCTASTYYNGSLAPGITYSATTQAAYAATGYSINQNTGALTFNSAGTRFYWNPNYPSLPINIIAYKDGSAIATKTMTINRNYPGQDGQPATIRWIETNANIIKYNPNTDTYSPTAVTGTVYKQVGDALPSADTSATLWMWYDNLTPTQGTGSITARAYTGGTVSLVTFGLKNSSNQFYETEEIPIISEGLNGQKGDSGQTGASGESAYYLTLSNDNASINCDSDGNILAGAYRPDCVCKLWYGLTQQSGATYSVNKGGATNLYTGVTDGILTISTSASTFSFTGNTLAVTVSAKTGGVTRDIKTFTLTKSIAGAPGTNGNTPYISGGTWWIGNTNTGIKAEGENGCTPEIGANGNWWICDVDTGVKAEGQDAVSYWLELSADEVFMDVNSNANPTPATVTATGKKQVGQGSITGASDCTIKACWVRKSDGTELSESAVTSVTFTRANFNTYQALRFKLYKGSQRVDMEEVSMMTNGTNGTNGESGESAYYLSLSNDSASINCDASGVVLTNAYKPWTNFKLMYGSNVVQQADLLSDLELYDDNTLVTSNYSTYGVDIVSGSGVCSAVTNNNLRAHFTGHVLTLVIRAYNEYGDPAATQSWTVTKSIAGENGEPAVSYWLELSTQDMIYDPNNETIRPSAVTATAYKQVGEDAAVPISNPDIRYKRVYRSTGAEETGVTCASTISINNYADAETYSIIRFRLYVSGQQVDMEDVGILGNGLNGASGTSIQGPAIRGPYDYYEYSATTRHWCAGSATTQCPECGQWLDIIVKDGVYYYCNTSYNGTLQQGMSLTYWTRSDVQYDFIAAGLILASGASINFLSGNEIKLMSGNTVTGGLRGGSGITFWAGQQLPENAPFRVDTNGSFSSTTGLIGGWKYNTSGLTWQGGGGGDDASYESTLGRSGLSFDYDDTIRKVANFGVEGIHFSTEENLSASTALYIGGDGITPITFEGGGLFNCKKLINNSGSTNVRIYDGLDIHDSLTLDNGQCGVVKSLFNPGFKIAFVTSSSTASSYFTRVPEYLVDSYSGGTWYFNNDMAVAEWNQNGGSGLYMVLTDSGMCREEVIVTLIEEAGNTYKTWRDGGSDDGYVIDVIQSGSTFYRCLYSYTGKLNWSSNYWRWTADTWSNIISNRYFYGDDMRSSIRANYPSPNQVGLPYRYAGMWCACNTSSPTSSSRFIPTGIFGPNFTNRRGDTLYIEV